MVDNFLAGMGFNINKLGVNPVLPIASAPNALPSNTPSISSFTGSVPLDDALLTDPNQFVPNILSGIDQPAYHFTLFMTNDKDVITATNSPKSSTQILANLQQAGSITIAESGVTGFNIKDVTFNSYVAPNMQTRNTNTTKITITITEPLGTSFLDAIRDSAVALKINNYSKVFYFLSLRFMGYDTNGNKINNVCSNFPNGGIWLYSLQIQDIDTKLDSGGGTYTLTCIPYNEDALSANLLKLPEMYNINAATIGEFFKTLGTNLTTSWQRRYGYQLYKISFVLHNIENQTKYDVNSAPLHMDPDLNNIRNAPLSNATSAIGGQFDRGTNVTDIVDYVFANSELGQQLIKDIDTQNKLDVSINQSTVTKFRECVTFRIYPDIEVLDFDPITNNYTKSITYHIKPYITQFPVLSNAQINDAKEKTTQQAMVTALKSRKSLLKAYYYLNTGLNTEVLDLNIQYNLAWNAVLPILEGYGNKDSYSVNAKVNSVDITNVREAQTVLMQYNDKLADINNQIQDTNDKIKAIESSNNSADQLKQKQQDLLANKEEYIKRINSLNNRISDAKSQIGSVQAPQYGKNTFAEDNTTTPGTLPIPISYIQDNSEPTNTVKGPYTNPYHRDKSIYGAVLDQLYGPMTTQLASVSLEIKGDPFWIGASNIDTRLSYLNSDQTNTSVSNGSVNSLTAASQTTNSPSTNLFPNFSDGDNLFLLMFSYPYNIASDGTPQINSVTNNTILKRREGFNGLYSATNVIHSFSGGIFKSTLTAKRLPLVDISKAFSVATTPLPDPGPSTVPTSLSTDNDPFGGV